MPTTYQAAWVFPVHSPPLRHGCVTIEQGRIVEIGSKIPTSGKAIDLGNVALLPRPINAHTHLEFSDLEAPLGRPRQSFAEWIAEVLSLRATRTISKAESVARGMEELRGALTGGVGEIATLPATAGDYGEAPPKGAAFHELLSTDLNRGLARLSEISALADLWPTESLLQFGLSPHAPYTVHWELLKAAVDLAKQRSWMAVMHLGESPDEMELLRSHSGKMHQLLADRGVWNPAGLPRGIGLADYLNVLAAAPRVLAIHGNFFGAEEYEILARHRERMTLVICPRTCDFFLPKLPPIGELLDQGIAIALGTDSRATNPDLSIWNEGRFLLGANVGLAPSEILRLTTLAGAEALGLAGDGAIAVGGAAENLAKVRLEGDLEEAEEAIAGALEGELLAYDVASS